MPQFIQILVILTLNLPMDTGRYHHLHPLLLQPFDDGVGVIAAVGDEHLGLQSCHEGQSLCAISDCTRRDSDSDR